MERSGDAVVFRAMMWSVEVLKFVSGCSSDADRMDLVEGRVPLLEDTVFPKKHRCVNL